MIIVMHKSLECNNCTNNCNNHNMVEGSPFERERRVLRGKPGPQERNIGGAVWLQRVLIYGLDAEGSETKK